MKVLIFETDLLWSVRLANGARALGHEAEVVGPGFGELPVGDVAIVNLGGRGYGVGELVLSLKEAGVFVIGHAGHKEKLLLEGGREFGCDKVVTNGSLAQRLDLVLAIDR